MAIVVNLDVMMAKRKMSVTELANKIDITMANLSILKNNKAKAVRFTTLDAICRVLDCQPEIYSNTLKMMKIDSIFRICKVWMRIEKIVLRHWKF